MKDTYKSISEIIPAINQSINQSNTFARAPVTDDQGAV